ncbi:hypothetical protein M422DRAFT_28523 [Sphaerobolus stellatus SS14]|uniref:Uncharacterized protein n=1 Tax=Sphaerobolus stellatus (strain SS14) TaxID=990650 RepID=A0A0C9VW44_SPHS4|nr:hypothetical protein M422DRAFT_28523 [Sphaerobolus stellatus SS14]
MPNWVRVNEFVKGYAFSDEKMASVFGFDASDSNMANKCFKAVIETALGDEGYLTLTCAYKDDPKKSVVVIVMDDDNDKESLMKRPSPGSLHPSISRLMEILEGPDVWKKT